jgi:hypothetical protein
MDFLIHESMENNKVQAIGFLEKDESYFSSPGGRLPGAEAPGGSPWRPRGIGSERGAFKCE